MNRELNTPPKKCAVCGGTRFVKAGTENLKGKGLYQRWRCKTVACATSVRGEKL